MFKKLLAFFTAICLLATLTISPIVVNATTTSKPSGMIVYEDNFDTTPIGDYNPNSGNGSPLPSDVFSAPNTNIAGGRGKIMVDPDNANNQVFQAYPTVDADYGKPCGIRSLYTKALDLGADAASGTWYAFSYDFKMGQTNANFYIAHDLFQLSNGGYIYKTTDSYTTSAIRQYTANIWYHVEIIAHDNTLNGWIFDAEGNLIATSNQRTYSSVTSDTNTKTTSEEKKLCAYSINYASANNRNGLITLDNVKLTQFNPSTAGPMFETTPDVSGNVAVSTDTKTVYAISDQIIDLNNSDNVKITKAGSGTRTCTIAGTSNPYKYKITLPDALTEDSIYTLNLSGLKNNMGTPAGDSAKFTFTTEGSIKLSSTSPAHESTNVNAGIKEMTATFSREATVYPETVTITGGDEVIVATVTQISATQFTLSWASREEDLKGETTYNVQLAGFKDSEQNEINTIISFTTEKTGITIFTDEFESGAQAEGYGYNTNQSADYLFTTGGNHTKGMISHAPGYTGNALQLKTGGSESGQCMNSLRTLNSYTASTYVNENGETEYEQFLLTYRINLKEPSKNTGEVIKHKPTDTTTYTKGGTKILIAATQNGNMSNRTNIAQFTSDENGIPYIGHDETNAGDEPVALQADHWYNVIWYVDGPNQRFALVDTENGNLVWSTEKDFSNYFSTGDAITIYPLGAARTTYSSNFVYNDSQTLLLDDFTLQIIKPWKKDHAVSIKNNDSVATIAPDGDLTVEFSRPTIINEYDMSLYETDSNGSRKSGYSTPVITYPDFNTRKISLPNLKYGHSYELDCSTLDDIKCTPSSQNYVIEFTTSDNPSDLSVYDEVTCTGLDIGDTVDFKLISKADTTANLVVAFYNRSNMQSLVGSEFINDYDLSIGENNVSISLTQNMQKAEYIKVFALNNFENVTPLMKAREIVAPKKAVKVLLIGTSMTEDTGRYLYDVASAGGLELDLTVKGIGGSNLSMHARNIKAELAGRTGADNIQITEDAKAEYNNGVANGTVDADFDWNPRVRYFTYKNGRYIDPADSDYTSDMASLTYTLKNEQFDVISINQASSGGCDPDIESLTYILTEIRKLQPDVQLVIHQTWFGWNTSDTDPARRYSIFTKGIEPVIKMFSEEIPLNAPGITYQNSPITIIPAGRAFYIADRKYEELFGVKYPSISTNDRPGEALYEEAEFAAATGLLRDSAHGSYYGCYLADACWYEFLTGKMAPVVTDSGEPAIAKPDSISDEEHIERLELLRDIAHEAMLSYK